MILSDGDIKNYIKEGKIKIRPLPNLKKQLGPASIDFRLGDEFRVFNHIKKPFIDPYDHSTFKKLTKLIKIDKNHPFVLQPNQFVLAVTLEELYISKHLGARIEGKSSWGRLGLIVHSTAGYIDPGFKGRLTLEMINIGQVPIILRPGINICQIAFEALLSPAEVPYNKRPSSKYYNDQHAQESRIYKEFFKDY